MSGPERPGQSPYEAPQVERIIRGLVAELEQKRPLPMSSSIPVNQTELLDDLEEVLERLPEELRAAKWLLKQREEFLARTRREADEILESARRTADEMMRTTEVVKAAEARARSVIDASDAEARRLKLEAEDFCDQRLASFEIVLERTMKVVAAGRAKLQGTRESDSEGPSRDDVAEHPVSGRPHLEAVPDTSAFFDQDDG